MDMSRIRIEGLLAAFPKLLGGGRQHTYVETDSIRYVYQPLEARARFRLPRKPSPAPAAAVLRCSAARSARARHRSATNACPLPPQPRRNNNPPNKQNLYLLLITNKQSNILEDLETLRLLAKVVPDFAGSADEEAVCAAAFDLIFAFDEVISHGHKENVTIQQARRRCLQGCSRRRRALLPSSAGALALPSPAHALSLLLF